MIPFVFHCFPFMVTSSFRRALTALLAFSLLLPSTSFAATSSIPDVMPDDVTVFTQIDLSQFTPKSLIDSLVKLSSNTFVPTPSESAANDTATAKKRADLAKEILIGGPFATGSHTGPSLDELRDYFVSTVNDVQWTSYMNLNGKDLEKKTYAGHEYYSKKASQTDDSNGGFSGSIARINQFLVGANSEASMKTLFDKIDRGEVLTKNANYQSTAGSVGTGSLVTAYLDLSSALRSVKDEMENGKNIKESVFSTAQHMGVALSQFQGGVSMSTVTSRAVGSKSGLYIPTPFAPSLYRYATAQHPLLYVEGANIAQVMKQQNDVDPDLQVFANLMTNGYSFTVEKGNGTFLPSFTFMADIKGNETEMASILKKTYEELVLSDPPEGISISGPTLGGLYDFSVTFSPDSTFWDEFEGVFPRMSTMFSLVVNLTKDGILVVSSKPNVMASYKTGMDTTEFGAIMNRTDVSALFSLNLSEITSISKAIVQQYYASLDEESKPYVDVNTTLNAIDQIFSPWQRLSGSGTSSATVDSGTMKLYFDPRVYESAYWEGVIKSSKTLDTSSTQYERVAMKFSDVPQDQWYAPDVKNLKARGVVKGYSDNSFKPNKPVTRIEFLAMLYRGVYGDAPSSFSMDGSMEGDVAFKDVQPFEWYYDILADSSKKGLVKGYSDNTFRPGALISRSEAVAMIARFYQYNNEAEFFVDLPWRDDRSFSDVPGNAWFGEAVHNAYKLGVVDGTPAGKFEPGRNLNRAEAAKLISKLLRKKVG